MRSNEAIEALRAAGNALGDIDVSGWDESALTHHLTDLSIALCELDSQLSRVADAVRARGFRIEEPAEPTIITGPVSITVAIAA
ncbi:hypothetical protein [Actinoplanes sp. N902-109]|uniref:hypothetical protein n=1 Tax=Actinoplanes sp. (strain N902-109) TaxID=649831 RepID=UPI0003294863|nr:hypothetical protein [Actinoplanes sp. N902-109]AGL14938.1 hypothetical protein L083_1428 [Actinoplanes sp. N902-109]